MSIDKRGSACRIGPDSPPVSRRPGARSQTPRRRPGRGLTPGVPLQAGGEASIPPTVLRSAIREEAAVDDAARELPELNAHGALPTTPTIDLAHQIMRVHRECATDYCRRKDQALQALISLGRIIPDSARSH